MSTLRKWILAASAVSAASCSNLPGIPSLLGDAEPDLVPLPAAGFCQSGGLIVVTVRNQGGGDADATMTSIRFTRGAPADVPTPGVAGGRITMLSPVGIPQECFDPDCVAQVTVDSRNDIAEADENNNSVEVTCPPPS